ncbi:cytochrome P450 [Roridomyces roridus]|uniref:Cytochrome P450 n=1 Tax=Roridomyces roridus TaxID=1738132 RepID=A0AAD7BZ37_9AGAR|nr:cytochrome P450 [Roridomyces roridus]
MTAVYATSAALALYTVYRFWARISITDVPGPAPESFLLGNVLEAQLGQAGEADFKWQEQYGHVVRVKGILGTDRLLISDPKALQHVFNCGYNMRKQGFRREIMKLLGGPGLAWAEGETHRRQRNINSPAFGVGQARSCIPVFAKYASKMSAQWKEKLAESDGESTVVKTPNYFTRFFLDVIGEAAFDYHFGTTDNEDDPFAKVLSSVAPALSVPTRTGLLIFGLIELLPLFLIQLFMQYAPVRALRNSRRSTATAVAFAKTLVSQKEEALLAGKDKRDILSLLIKANTSNDPGKSLTENELYAQIQTITQGGHETTAITMSWTLWELTKHPEVQAKMREEIAETERAMGARGDSELNYTDLEAMPFTIAVMKETLRIHPVSPNSMREATRDEVLPLSKPMITKSGRTITELPIPKHQILILSICGYNRNPDVFGADPHVFRPERWLDESMPKVETNLGVYGNLMTFGSGHRACIGWRFAMYEYQTFLVELVKNFEFSMDPELSSRVRRQASLGMPPFIAGELHKGTQLPLTITAVRAV